MMPSAAAVEAMAAEGPRSEGRRTPPRGSGPGGPPNLLRRKSAPHAARGSGAWAGAQTTGTASEPGRAAAKRLLGMATTVGLRRQRATRAMCVSPILRLGDSLAPSPGVMHASCDTAHDRLRLTCRRVVGGAAAPRQHAQPRDGQLRRRAAGGGRGGRKVAGGLELCD